MDEKKLMQDITERLNTYVKHSTSVDRAINFLDVEDLLEKHGYTNGYKEIFCSSIGNEKGELIGICIDGDFEKNFYFSEEQLESIRKTCKELEFVTIKTGSSNTLEEVREMFGTYPNLKGVVFSIDKVHELETLSVIDCKANIDKETTQEIFNTVKGCLEKGMLPSDKLHSKLFEMLQSNIKDRRINEKLDGRLLYVMTPDRHAKIIGMQLEIINRLGKTVSQQKCYFTDEQIKELDKLSTSLEYIKLADGLALTKQELNRICELYPSLEMISQNGCHHIFEKKIDMDLDKKENYNNIKEGIYFDKKQINDNIR